MTQMNFCIIARILGLVLVLVLGSGWAQAQSFDELKKNDSNATLQNSAILDEQKAKLFQYAIPSEDALKSTMKPEEYEQFMAARAYAEKSSTYTLGPTDLIEINVLRHPEVSGQFVINHEGKIQYEFAGDIVVAGLTKEKATEYIAKILETYIVNPQVTIKIVGYNSKIVYVVGEVGAPGKIFMRGDTITVREALLDAGLPLLSANTKQSSMFTPSANGKVERRRVNIDALLYRGDLRENLVMKPGDTLYVPATFWAKAMRIMNPISQPIGQAASTGATVTTGF